MPKILTIIFLSITLISFKLKAQSIDNDKKRIDNVCDTFMRLFTASDTHAALRLLKQNTIIAPDVIDTLEMTIDNQMENYIPTYGKMISYEFISESKIKDCIAKRFYILKLNKYYLKFSFILHKSSSGWTITDFKYNDNVDEILKQ